MKRLFAILSLLLIFVSGLYSQNKKFGTDSLRVNDNLNVLDAGGDTTLFVGAGKVGIGTGSPEEDLHILSSLSSAPTLQIESTTSSANGGFLDFILDKGAAAADFDEPGNIRWFADNSAAAKFEYVQIQTSARDVTSGDEAGRQLFLISLDGGVLTEFMRLDGGIAVGQGEIEFNQGAVADINFVVNAASAANAFFMQGSDGFIGFGTATPSEELHLLSSAISSPTLLIESTHAGGNFPSVTFFKNKATPADDVGIGALIFRAENATPTEDDFASIRGTVKDVTVGSEGGEIGFFVTMNSSDRELLSLSGYEGVVDEGLIVFNEDAQDIDLRVEGTGKTAALFVEGATDDIGIGTSDPSANLHIDESGGTDGTGRWFANASVSTTDATTTTIYTLATVTDRAYRLVANVISAQDDGSNSMGTSWSFVFKNVAGTVTEQQDVVIGTEFDDSAGVSISGAVSGTNYLIQVTGIAAENWNWELSVDATIVAH